METVSRPATGEASGLPFSGLGHDMSALNQRACLLELCAFRPVMLHPVVRGFMPVRPETLPAVAGFGLLVALGREIRGR